MQRRSLPHLGCASIGCQTQHHEAARPSQTVVELCRAWLATPRKLGNGSTTSYVSSPAAPIDLGPGAGAQAIATGLSHACALLSDGTVQCWGYNAYGQLGYGNTTQRTTPGGVVDLGTGRTAQRIAVGSYHTCAILDDDSLKCWGYNSRGQLGYEDTNQRSAPAALAVNLGSGRVATRLIAADEHTCALLDDNGLKCWGHNDSDVFGTGVNSGQSIGDQTGEMGNLLPEVLP